mmetsp:Transcript_29052/g.90553  ORF Transcript_29052/g.90553 Transcript_29052/m.90553 type:complete len:256 (+) Transcript_29052:269-1036(+)
MLRQQLPGNEESGILRVQCCGRHRRWSRDCNREQHGLWRHRTHGRLAELRAIDAPPRDQPLRHHHCRALPEHRDCRLSRVVRLAPGQAPRLPRLELPDRKLHLSDCGIRARGHARGCDGDLGAHRCRHVQEQRPGEESRRRGDLGLRERHRIGQDRHSHGEQDDCLGTLACRRCPCAQGAPPSHGALQPRSLWRQRRDHRRCLGLGALPALLPGGRLRCRARSGGHASGAREACRVALQQHEQVHALHPRVAGRG